MTEEEKVIDAVVDEEIAIAEEVSEEIAVDGVEEVLTVIVPEEAI